MSESPLHNEKELLSRIAEGDERAFNIGAYLFVISKHYALNMIKKELREKKRMAN